MVFLWRIISDLGCNSSRTKMGMNPKTKRGKWRTSIGDFCRMGGNHTTWRRFQDKWGRSATLNRRFKDKDRWFWGEPQDLRENSNFHITQIWIQKCVTRAYILWVETPKGPTTKGPIKPKQKHYKNYKSVLVLQSKANPRSLLRSWTRFYHCSEILVTILNHASIIVYLKEISDCHKDFIAIDGIMSKTVKEISD